MSKSITPGTQQCLCWSSCSPTWSLLLASMLSSSSMGESSQFFFFLLFCILFVCFVWLVRYFRLFCLACLFYKSLEQGIVMILPGGTLCTKSFLCVFCFLFCSVGWLCFVCLLGLVLLVCCNFFSSARTFNNFAQGGLCTGSSFCLVLCAGD